VLIATLSNNIFAGLRAALAAWRTAE